MTPPSLVCVQIRGGQAVPLVQSEPPEPVQNCGDDSGLSKKPSHPPSSTLSPSPPLLALLNNTVPIVDPFRFLGSTFSCDLKWSSHTDSFQKVILPAATQKGQPGHLLHCHDPVCPVHIHHCLCWLSRSRAEPECNGQSCLQSRSSGPLRAQG